MCRYTLLTNLKLTIQCPDVGVSYHNKKYKFYIKPIDISGAGTTGRVKREAT